MTVSENGELQGEYVFLPQEKVLYGAGTVERVVAEAKRMGCRRALIITGRTLTAETPLIGQIETILGERHAQTYAGIRQHAPESGIVEATERARECQADLLVSVGGGSPIDAAKAVARALSDGDDDFMPHIAISTTLSAAEFSHLAGYKDEARKVKTGFADPRATPRTAILDPEMTFDTPMWLWLSTGIRALDHAVETLYGPGYHPVNDVLALRAIRDLFEFLPRSIAEPDDAQVRLRCQLAAWMSFFGPPNMERGLSHMIGRTIGATYDVPHGITSCITLPHVMRHKAGSEPEAAALATMARALGVAADDVPDRRAALAAADAVVELVEGLGVTRRLRDVSVAQTDFEDIAQAVAGDSPQKAEVLKILQHAW